MAVNEEHKAQALAAIAALRAAMPAALDAFEAAVGDPTPGPVVIAIGQQLALSAALARTLMFVDVVLGEANG